MVGGPLNWRWSGVRHIRVVAKTSKDANREVSPDLNLARESDVWREISDFGEASDLGLGLGTRFALKHLNPTRRAPSVATAAMQNIHP
jgi:hypothetical protein